MGRGKPLNYRHRPKPTTELYVRAHGKFYESDGLIHKTYMPPSCKIKFYGPPGYAMGGGLADDLLGETGPLSARNMGQKRRNSPDDLTTPGYGRTDTIRVRYFDRIRGYSHPQELGFSRSGDKIRNYLIIGEDYIDGQRAGIFELHKPIRFRQQRKLRLFRRLRDGDEMTLKDLIREVKNDRYLRDENVTIHYIQCRSFASTNRQSAHRKPHDAGNYKQDYIS